MFYRMCLRAALTSFVCPDALGSQASFKTVFAAAIARAQDRNATPEEVALGGERSTELNRQIDGFLLRRTSAAIAKFLPPLTSYVVFCWPSSLQVFPPPLAPQQNNMALYCATRC